MEPTNRLLSFWPGFLLWARLREAMVSWQAMEQLLFTLALLKQKLFSLNFFKYKQQYLLNGYWRCFPALQPLRLGISSLRKEEPCLDVSSLSLGTAAGLCRRANEQQDMHWPQGAAAGPRVWGSFHALTAAPAAPTGAIVTPDLSQVPAPECTEVQNRLRHWAVSACSPLLAALSSH